MSGVKSLNSIECVNCGYMVWSLSEDGNCPRCGATAVNTKPTVTNEHLKGMTIIEVIALRKKHRQDIICDNGIPHFEREVS